MAAPPPAPRNPNAAIAGVFNYAENSHLKIYEKNTESLYGNDKKSSKFDLETDQLQEFLARFGTRSKRCGWEAMLTYAVNGVRRYFVDHYGEVPIASVRAKAVLYLSLQQRLSQDGEQMYHCLLNSLTPAAFNQLTNVKEEYHVLIGVAPNQEEVTDGPLLLATIVSLAYTNTRAMGAIYRTNLMKLDAKIVELEGANIVKLNAYVKLQRNLIAAGGGKCDDIPYHLLRAYKLTGDAEFTSYIKQKEQAWKDGLVTWDTQGTTLMALAETFYKDAIETGEWQKASAEQTRIIALEAQLLVNETKLQLAMSSVQNYQHSFKRRQGGKMDPRPPRQLRSEDAWKLIAPKHTDPKTKKMNNKTYHWCVPHKMWTIHSTAECRLAQTKVEVPPVMTTVVADEFDTDSYDSNVDSFADDNSDDDQGSNTA